MTAHTVAPRSQFASKVSAGLVRQVVYPLWTKRSHPAYARYLHEFEQNQYLSPDELQALQLRKLRQQLMAAYRYVPLYRHRMTEAGLTPLDIQTHDDLRLLPVLTKRDIQDQQDMLAASNVAASKRLPNQTDASIGSPLHFYVDRERFDSRLASTDRHNAWAGLRPGEWFAQLWGSTVDVGDKPDPNPSWRQKLLYRSLTLHTAAVGEESLMRYVEVLRRYRPRYMVASAESAVLFTEFCRRNNIDDIAFESMIVSADTLPPGKRQAIEDTFGGRVFNRYGCREVSVIASECEFHSGLHVNADALIVEVVPAPNLPAGMGRVLVTDLLNRSMPLIRYEIGDLANLDPGVQCPCGRSLPLMGNIQGRTSDTPRLSNGHMIAGPSLAPLGADMRDVRQVQFIQRDPHSSTLKVVAGNEYNPLREQEPRRRMESYVEDASSLTIAKADSIPSEPSGKYRFVKKTDNTIEITA